MGIKKRTPKLFLATLAASLLVATVAFLVSAYTQSTNPAPNGRISATIAPGQSNLIFSPGETFDVVVRIDDNTGFAGMMLRLGVPPELELIGMQLNPLLNHGFSGVSGWDGTFAVSPPITGNAFAGWSRSTDFTGNDELIIYTLRVRDGAPTIRTSPITLAFANAMPPFYELPTDANNDTLIISLPGGLVGLGDVAEIGRVTIGTGLLVSADPGHRNMVNRVGYSVAFEIIVGGMPPNEIFCFENPDPAQTAGIEIEGLPDGIAATGYVETDNEGNGSGVLTLTITDTNSVAVFDDLISAFSDIFSAVNP